MLFEPRRFDVSGVAQFFRAHPGELACYYEMGDDEDQSKRGVLELDQKTKQVTSFVEKPQPGATASRLASIVFYMFRKGSLSHIKNFLTAHPDSNDRSFGMFMQYLVPKTVVHGIKVGNLSLLLAPMLPARWW